MKMIKIVNKLFIDSINLFNYIKLHFIAVYREINMIKSRGMDVLLLSGFVMRFKLLNLHII